MIWNCSNSWQGLEARELASGVLTGEEKGKKHFRKIKAHGHHPTRTQCLCLSTRANTSFRVQLRQAGVTKVILNSTLCCLCKRTLGTTASPAILWKQALNMNSIPLWFFYQSHGQTWGSGSQSMALDWQTSQSETQGAAWPLYCSKFPRVFSKPTILGDSIERKQ